MVGVLTVPLKGSENMFRSGYSLTDSHSVFENFHIVWTNKTGESDVEVTPACSGVELHGAAILPVPHSLESWPSFERNGRGARFQMLSLETISMPRRNGQGPESSLKRLWIFV